MTGAPESILFCEGYDDRDFWRGWLVKRGCKDARKEQTSHGVTGGYVFATPAKRILHVIPCGTARVSDVAQQKLQKRTPDKPIARLVINVDVDARSLDDVRRSMRAVVGPTATETAEGDFSYDDGLVVSPILWHVPHSPLAGVPAQQSIERVVCAALAQVHPTWGTAVSAWLSGRPEPSGKDHKAHAWSFRAGWFTGHGEGFFYTSLWDDPQVGAALLAVLKDTGAARAVDALLM